MKEQYQVFLEGKQKFGLLQSGIDVSVDDVNTTLFDWQKEIVVWALRRGRAAIFEDCGMGKTFQQLEWARIVHTHTSQNVLILAPLSVGAQTVEEGKKLGISINQCRDQKDVLPGINITNYEMLSHFDVSAFGGVVLDESSILKSFTGKIRNEIITMFDRTPFKLACTATPAPNDHMELGNHAEFLGIMNRVEMLSMYFVHDGGETSKWRLKGHAEIDFWKWVASWAVMIRRPSDMGYSDDGFVLPRLIMHEHIIAVENDNNETLFAVEANGLMERRQSRRKSLYQRVEETARLVNESSDQWVIWCNLNDEGDALESSIDGAVQVSGSDTPEFKMQSVIDFQNGKIRVLISKPSICGFGMNWQHCHNVAFVGLSDSWEQFYQAVRRCWRFGQHNDVSCHIIISDMEGAVLKNIQRKEKDALKMGEEMAKFMKGLNMDGVVVDNEHDALISNNDIHQGNGFTMYRGDCVEVLRSMPDNSAGYSIFSPPFSSLYTYSNDDRDMGNCINYEQFCEHFTFLVKELKRVLMPGRLVSLHCFDIPAMKQRDGFIGLIDFPADLRKMFQDEGFVYHSKVTIWKDPVVQMQRTKALGLLHKQVRKDSSMSRQGLADYVITMRLPSDNTEPISHTHETFPVDRWQQYASPVWMDINPSRTLNREGAREDKDERHICPLQLDVIERCIELWSNPGDTVLSPFAGIGSEPYCAVKMGRVGVGVELKKSYYEQAIKNCEVAVIESGQQSLLL